MTRVTWVKNHPVIGVSSHLPVVILWRDERFGYHAFIKQEIWQDDDAGNPEVMGTRHSRPCRWQKNTLSYRE